MPADAPLIRRLQEGADRFSRHQRTLARHVLQHQEAVAFATAAELAAQAGVSEPTVVRFAKALSFSGYPEFQKEVRRLLRADLRGLERLQQGAPAESARRTPLDLVLETERRNLATLQQSYDARRFGAAVRMLARATTVMVVGTRSTAALAHHLAFALGKIGIDAVRVTAVTTETYDRLGRLGPRGCVVVIGFPRYLREHVEVLAFAAARRTPTLAITDSVFSPLAADVVLHAPAESASFIAFHGAPLALVNALAHEVSAADPARTRQALRQFEAVAERQNYFVKE